MISQRIYDLCRSGISVSSALAEDPTARPQDIIAKLDEQGEVADDETPKVEEQAEGGSKDLQRARDCGKWGKSHPSDLFLQIYHDALCALELNTMSGLISPSLMGSCGVVPLTIIGPLSDICRHMSNCIARAEKEVFLVTSYWVHSNNARLITNGMRELSRRAGKRGERVVMKIMYDRGSVRQILNSRQVVDTKEATSSKVQLPAPEEIPNIDLQVVNYHRIVVGTLHSKFMIVDRKLALLESNNIQDNDNLEMMVRVEGPIVDSFYDMALISWNTALDGQLPLIDSSAALGKPPSFEEGQVNGEQVHGEKFREHLPDEPHYDPDIHAEAARINASLTPRKGEKRRDCVTRHLTTGTSQETTGNAREWDKDHHMTPYILHPPHDPFPIAMVNREPWGALNHSSIDNPQNGALLAAIRHAKESIFIQTPDMNAEYILDALLEAVRRGVTVTAYLCLGYNDAGELLPFQNGTNEMTGNRMYNALSSEEEKDRLRIYNYVAKDQTKPIHNRFKQRSCHIKLMIVDEQVAIQGNANLDTQSFFHSQETNLLLDSPAICKSWLDALARNQNTATYGAVSKEDGCWRDPRTGEIAAGSMGTDPGRFSWIKGVVGAIKRVRGNGGF